mmetsp:Transcript_12933/g.11065  ORF Transcript_12933/g.11065 Transcript_12933/m.11065 type:complete len:82 (-) Transcript_12933:281-526(-)
MRKERIQKLSHAVQSSPVLDRLNTQILKALIYGWKEEAEARILPDKEDILIEFNSLELISTIIQPTLKVEITVNSGYPESL